MRIGTPAVLAALMVLIGGSAFAQVSGKSPDGAPTPVPMPRNAAAASGAVAGKWVTTNHTGNWTKTITLFPDGSFLVAGDAAPDHHWYLSDSNGHILLTLAWARWPAQTAIMEDGATFRGGGLEMHRAGSADTTSSTGEAAQPAPAVEAPATLAGKLANTTWTMDSSSTMDPSIGWFTLNADMTVRCGWNNEVHGWKVINESTIKARVTHKKIERILTFNSDLTVATDQFHRTYQRIQPRASASAAASVPREGQVASQAPSHGTTLEVLSDQAPNVSAWVLAPLDETIPPDIRESLTLLREDLLDEAKASPKSGPKTYQIGRELCDSLLAVLDQRDATLVKYGYSAAQARNNTVVTSQALEADRNHQMSWPQYAREQRQAHEIFRQQMNHMALANQLPKVDWANRAALIRRTLDTIYAEYREALRNSI